MRNKQLIHCLLCGAAQKLASRVLSYGNRFGSCKLLVPESDVHSLNMNRSWCTSLVSLLIIAQAALLVDGKVSQITDEHNFYFFDQLQGNVTKCLYRRHGGEVSWSSSTCRSQKPRNSGPWTSNFPLPFNRCR